MRATPSRLARSVLLRILQRIPDSAVVSRIDDNALVREVGRRSRATGFSFSDLLRKAGDSDLVNELARRDRKRNEDDVLLVEGLPVRQQMQLLSAPDDDALVVELLRRMGQADLGASVDPRLLGTLVEGFRPTRRLEYERHPIELAVSSEASYKRVRAVQKEPFTVDWLERSVCDGDVVYDIGANVGAYSLIAGKLVTGGATVYAFEPAAPNFSDLCRNVALNGCEKNVVPLPVALWSRTGFATFGYRSFSPGDASHTISDDADNHSAESAQRILAFRLDDFVSLFAVPVPSLVKLDVDGAELNVLRGAVGTISQPDCREIMVEVNDLPGQSNVGAVNEILARCGFHPVERHDRGAAGIVPYMLFGKTPVARSTIPVSRSSR
jgi:FkbM family methyltransferase